MKGVLILLVTAIVVCVGNRTQGVHRHRNGKTGHKPERNTGSITLKPGTAMNTLFSGYGTNFRYIGEVKNGVDRVTVVTSIPIPKYSDIEKRPIIFNKCIKDLWRQGARTKGQPQHETYTKCNRVLAQAKFYQSQQEELQFLLPSYNTHTPTILQHSHTKGTPHPSTPNPQQVPPTILQHSYTHNLTTLTH